MTEASSFVGNATDDMLQMVSKTLLHFVASALKEAQIHVGLRPNQCHKNFPVYTVIGLLIFF